MVPAVRQLIKDNSTLFTERPGTRVTAISHEGVCKVAEAAAISIHDSQSACLNEGVVPLRYLRNLGTIGIEGQLKLLQSRAAVCGAGGLGGTIVELLARQGLGNIVVIDNGRFDETNLNRQILSTLDNLGQVKVQAAAQRVIQINPAVTVTPVCQFISGENVDGLLKGADVVMDGLDNLETRMLVASACSRLGIPFVHGAIAGFNGQLMSILPGDKGLAGVYGSPADGEAQGLEAITGTPPATPAIIAAWQVQEAVKILTGVGGPVHDRLLFLDFAQGSLEEIPII